MPYAANDAMSERTVLNTGTLPDLDDLRVLCAVASDGGVNGAARALRLPRSTISRRLARLEERLATRLFRRTRRGLTLTDGGARLLERARAVLDQVDALLVEAAGTGTSVRGQLRLTAPADLVGERDVWLRFAEENPELTVEIDFTNRYVDIVRERYDLAVRAGRGPDESLVTRRLGFYHLHAVASPEYLRAFGPLDAPAELRAHSCLLLSAFGPRRDAQGPAAPHRHLVLSDAALALEGARRGMGIAILPPSLVADDLASGRLVPVLPAYNPLRVPLHAAYADHRRPSAAQEALLRHLTRAFAEPASG
jgi:DNA-binding transcriptional LysR family regulator